MTVTDGDRDLLDLLAEEFAEGCRRGESPSIGDFEARHPAHAGRIREVLEAVALMEELRGRKLRGRAAATAAPQEALDEKVLGDFRIVREIGRGGMGIVYEAEQLSLGRRVALKVLPQPSLFDPARLLRFQREAQAAARLHHTNIVPVLGVGEHRGVRFIVMQFIEGRGLDAVVRGWKSGTAPAPGSAAGPVPSRAEDRLRWIARVGLQVAEAIQYAHDQGVLHRDIKPANILIDGHGDAWVTDFGLAKLEQGDDLTRTGDIIGTLGFMAPERFQSSGDARSDVYSLGLTLYELLTLAPGFQDADPSRLIRQICEGRPVPPRALNPAIDRDLETIVLKATAREPERRYATARELAVDLARFLEDRPILARRSSALEQALRWCRRNRALAALGATAAASLVVAAVAGWVGYVRTNDALGRESLRRGEAERATRRAEENVALSIGAIRDLLHRIAPEAGGRRGESGDGPAQRFPAPPFGPPEGRDLAGRRRARPSGPGPEADRPGGARGARGGGAPGEPRGGGHDSSKEVELLQSILTFYDEFAARNVPDPALRRDAAQAYRHIGDLQDLLGKPELAAPAFERAEALYETLAGPNGQDEADCRLELADAYASEASMRDPGDPGTLRRLAGKLRRAQALAEEPDAAPAGSPDRARVLAHVRRELGRALEALGQTVEAEVALRAAVAAAEALDPRRPAAPPERVALADARRSLAGFLARKGRREEARDLLERSADDLLAEPDEPIQGIPGRVLLPRFEDLAEALRELGDPELADELAEEASRRRGPSRFGPPGRPDFPGGPPPGPGSFPGPPGGP